MVCNFVKVFVCNAAAVMYGTMRVCVCAKQCRLVDDSARHGMCPRVRRSLCLRALLHSIGVSTSFSTSWLDSTSRVTSKNQTSTGRHA
eukprot:706213-Amphidinium_carterae.1